MAKGDTKGEAEQKPRRERAEPEVERGFTDPLAEQAAKDAAKPRKATGSDTFEDGTWADLPRYACPYCGHAVAARSDSDGDRALARGSIVDHVVGNHPEHAPQTLGEA